MKRFFIPILLFLCGACTNTIDYDFSQVKPELMVVGWLEQASTNQTICFSISEDGLVKPAEDARVVCTVNGKEVADVTVSAEDASEQTSYPFGLLSVLTDPSYYRQLPVSFQVSLRPGDKVKLMFEANHGTFKASSAELTVPESVEIVKVDTARVSVQHLDWSDQYLQVRADVSDRRGEDNWWRFPTEPILLWMVVRTSSFRWTPLDISWIWTIRYFWMVAWARLKT